MERRSAKYSDRLHLTMLSDLMGWDWLIGTMSYGDLWRARRRAFQKHFSPSAIEKYQPVHSWAVNHFLRRLAENPEDLFHHIRHTFAVIIMMCAYGIDVSEANDEFVMIAEEAMSGFVAAGVPGAFLVDFIPILRYIPAWFPGVTFKRKAQHWRLYISMMLENPWEFVQNSLRKDGATTQACIATTILERLPEGESGCVESETIGKSMLGSAFAGGADTTVSTVQLFFLAMSMYPEVQKRAQDELDTVVGPYRLPTEGDRCLLPYTQALISELLRWQPIAPLAIPHYTSDNDEYRGYFIPKGSVVIANFWAVLHDPVAYPDPETFNPERFLKDGQLDPSVQDPRIACFGFGRRICPGRYISESSLFAITASVLHVYNISPALDAQGRSVHPQLNMTSGVISYPEAFRCSIAPRSDSATALIQSTKEDTPLNA